MIRRSWRSESPVRCFDVHSERREGLYLGDMSTTNDWGSGHAKHCGLFQEFGNGVLHRESVYEPLQLLAVRLSVCGE